MNTKLPIGFIGAGAFVNCQHLPNALLCPHIEVRAIADINEETLAQHQQKLKLPYVTTDYNKILQDEKIKMVVIGTRHDLHAKIIVECLDAGKWVLCEKPMATTETEINAVLQAQARNPRVRLAIGFNRRFAPAYRKAKELMQQAKRPWFVNYRIVNQNSHMMTDFYAKEPHMAYEGCHILDLARWLLDADPVKVYMTGDHYKNNSCILSFADGSQFQLLCASVGAVAYWKENIEIFAADKTIGINDFIDMRVRGFEGESDRLFAPHRNEHAAEVMKYGFEFYELYIATRANEYIPSKYHIKWKDLGVANPPVKRPTELPFNIDDYHKENADILFFSGDKGWSDSISHLAQCCLEGKIPDNADAAAGAKAAEMTMALLHSLETGKVVDLNNWYKKKDCQNEPSNF